METTDSDQSTNTYIIADTLFPPAGLAITLNVSYDAFARRHGVGACHVRVSLPDGTAFDSPGSIPIIDSSDPAAARPLIILSQPSQLSPLPEGSSCTILSK